MSAEKKLVGDALKEALKNQVEFYFSKANLVNDSFLEPLLPTSLAHARLRRLCRYVPLDVIVGFSKIKQLTDDVQLVAASIKDSTVCSLSPDGDAVKPNIKSERNTIILREIPSATAPAEVEAIFDGKATSVRSDVGDTWFVTMATEEDAVATLLTLRSKTFNDAPIKARLKSENVLRSFVPSADATPSPSATPYQPSGASSFYGNAAYYSQAVPNAFGVQYAGRTNGMTKPQAAAAAPKAKGKKGAAAGAAAAAGATTPTNGKKAKDKKKKETPAAGGAPKSAGKHGERQPIMNAAHFPPLPTVAPGMEVTYKYSHDDIMEIVKHMDDPELKLPAGKMDFEAHESALTPVAHPDLLKNQRTYSIEQAREALRQGRPIRSDSVGSVDYESMMYGEEYTKEARELRAAQQAKEGSDAVESKKNMSVGGYAAALIHGQPVSPKKAVAVAVAAPVTEKKDEKKEPKAKTPKAKKADKKEQAPPAPVTGAWGGRSFVDVVTKPPTPTTDE
ncbi:Aste57867_25123 [Aphanomyces stellatus]|uniref:Aste57867_25123 protein n=1 Tax=Aphanomyces stellatus TaxID=120398 RepID=A0A485LTN9_9STRA|nr:hypothetical protein As57867_025045 [Aphanomyces stellatus]VFU01754.1 Aste57867_25123 [Aphanomyces stellatus]